MAAVEDPVTHAAPAPVIPADARLLLPRDPARGTAVLYRRFGTTVYRFAWHMLGSKEDAEDATQATFLSVHSALQSGTAIREPQAWVMKIARNECLARITQRMRRPLMDSLDDEMTAQVAIGGPSVSAAVEMRGDLDAASSALGRLPTSQREAFVLREWVGMSTTEIALSLGTTVSAVDALLNRARRELIRVVGGGDGAASCSVTRSGLADGMLDRAARAHLVRCKACRQVRRVMQPQLAAARAIFPPAALAARLADSLPGFAASSSAAGVAGSAAAGGGGIAAVVAKMATAPAAVKGIVAAVAAVAAVGGGVAAETSVTRSDRPAGGTKSPAALQLGSAGVSDSIAPVVQKTAIATPAGAALTATDVSGKAGAEDGGSKGVRPSSGSGEDSVGAGKGSGGVSGGKTGDDGKSAGTRSGSTGGTSGSDGHEGSGTSGSGSSSWGGSGSATGSGSGSRGSETEHHGERTRWHGGSWSGSSHTGTGSETGHDGTSGGEDASHTDTGTTPPPSGDPTVPPPSD